MPSGISGLFPNTQGAKDFKKKAMEQDPKVIAEKLYYLAAINSKVEHMEIPQRAAEMDYDLMWDVLKDEDISINDLVHSFVDLTNDIIYIRDLLEKAYKED